MTTINIRNEAQKQADDERAQRRWTVRRRLAKASFALLVVEIVAGLGLVAFDKADADVLVALATYLATPTVGLFSIIGLYIGFSTKDDIKMAEIANVARDV